MAGRAKRSMQVYEPPTGWHWTDDALCRDHEHPEWWTSESSYERRVAAALCDGCPVGSQCLDAVLSFPAYSRWHVWGGFAWHGGKYMP